VFPNFHPVYYSVTSCIVSVTLWSGGESEEYMKNSRNAHFELPRLVLLSSYIMNFFASGSWTIALGLCLASTVLGDTRDWNPTGDGCVDSTGFLSCYETQSNNAVSCVQFCESNNVKGTQVYQDCILGCNGAWLASNLGCWIQSCWNQVSLKIATLLRS
jgi:hypothetical protein